MANYNDGNWHGWNGGECPVHPNTFIECIYYSNPRDPNSEACASVVDLASVLWDCDVIAFRVTKEHKEPREFLIDTSTMQIVTAGFEGMPGIIHVREVMEGEE